MKENLAALDVDGTLYDGNLGINYLKHLIPTKDFNSEIGKKIFSLYDKYKKGQAEKSLVVDEIYKLYALGMKGIKVEIADEIADKAWQTIKNNLYPFAPKIVQTLKKEGYICCLLSGSPIEMVQKVGETLEIDKLNIVAGTLEIIDGIYTGNIVSYLGSAEQKSTELDKLVSRRNLNVDWPVSVGIGDNERDIGILARVGYAIAFSPNDKLAEEANRNGWIVADSETISDTVIECIKPRWQTPINSFC